MLRACLDFFHLIWILQSLQLIWRVCLQAVLKMSLFGMEELGLMDCKEEKEFEVKGFPLWNGKVKVEDEENAGVERKAVRKCHAGIETDTAKGPFFELSFDFNSPATCGEEDEKDTRGEYEDDDGAKRKILLSLDYEAVMTAWASQGSPWTNGNRPDFDPDECWPDCMGVCGAQLHHPYGDMISGLGAHPAMVDGGREARVSRYREKRRTRLFSKKIRYEVRKLNAEKRPRMKGRFVKRTTLAGK
uniref:Zinc finger protein CONSTANS-LIKE 6 n=1 Tax=Populus alba TaxID=43335 RepID=A0A4U5NMQ5_POPAL|nr:zinc finger protein CONSTANS-LIKE 6 [Populus alba]